jgi:hypothetical protein
MQAVLVVARRHRGAPLVLEPITVALVEAMLRTLFPYLQVDDRFWQGAAKRIATVLYDSPDGQQRLIRFWSQLCELVQ